MLVAIGSDNPVKIKAVESAFKSVWPTKKFQFVGKKTESGVSSQPKSDKESIRGARNRARKIISKTTADFGVGVEGGLQKIGEYWFDSGWVVIIDKKGREGIGSSVKMLTPQRMVKLLKKYKELGAVDDYVFKIKNSKQKLGHFGLMTKGILNRERGYRDAAVSALVRFIHPNLF